MCSVWEYNHMTQCWQGVGHSCGKSDWQGSDLLATGAQRIQHGDVYVLRDMKGWEVDGLADLGDTTWGSFNDTDGAVNCRSWCYSNIRCQLWSYIPGHCFADDPGATRHGMPYPLVLNVNARTDSTLAKQVIAGEFITHHCPPEPASLGNATEALSTPMVVGPREILLDVVIALVIVWAFARIWFRMRGQEDKLRIAWLEAAGGEEQEMALEGTPSMAVTGLQNWDHRVMPTALETMVTPGLLDVLLHRTFATSHERREVRRAAPQAPPLYANFLAWRRMCVASLFIVGVVSYIMQVRVLFSTWRHFVYFSSLGSSNKLNTYQTWVATNPPNPSFLQYTEEKMMMLLGHILGEVLRGAFLTDLVVCAVELAPLICLFIALFWWTSFSSSRRYVLAAWLTSFTAAYGMSLFPVRSLLHFGRSEAEADEYVQELVVALHLDKAQSLLLGSCDSISEAQFSSRLNDLGGALKKLCDNLSMFPLELALPCIDKNELCHVNLGDALEGCNEAVQQFEIGHVDRASGILKDNCKKISDAFVSPSSGTGKVDSTKHAFQVLVDMIRIPFRLVVPSVELTSLTISALHTILMVVPSVVSIGPGLMAAGYMTKVLAPHSALPGGVVLVVPIVCASLSWLIYTVLFQYITQVQALILLIICVSYPLVYIGIGLHFNIALPISSQKLQEAARASTVTNIAVAVALGALAFSVVKEINPKILQGAQSGMDLLAWCHVSWSRLGLAIASRTIYCFALTYFGASEWIISALALQQRYWMIYSRGGGEDDEGASEEDVKLGRPRLITRAPGEDIMSEEAAHDDDKLNEAVWELLNHRTGQRFRGFGRRVFSPPLLEDEDDGPPDGGERLARVHFGPVPGGSDEESHSASGSSSE